MTRPRGTIPDCFRVGVRPGTSRTTRLVPLLPLLSWTFVLAGAAERPLRIPALMIAIVGLLLAARRPSDGRTIAWAAPVPVAALLVLALFAEPTALGAAADCGSLAPLRVVRRLLEAAIVLGITGVVAHAPGVPATGLRLRVPSRTVGILSVIAFLAAAPLAVAVGPALAEPFFGRVALPAVSVLALAPLLVAALANATQEEVAYRGAWFGWGELRAGPWLALIVQALAFGLAHTGTDFTGPQLPVVAAMAAGGLVAGLIARRTGSLAPPIALHAAADVPMILYAVCGPS